jgi:hypothetical protein
LPIRLQPAELGKFVEQQDGCPTHIQDLSEEDQQQVPLSVPACPRKGESSLIRAPFAAPAPQHYSDDSDPGGARCHQQPAAKA